ncbi:MAG: D-alanine--D-alanine ligase [Bacteroidetes bacterium]|jgi:D-alanine-D-alanine ligase|nr:D-alanine--D-alanine ligase [Bacteroidota bacterium]
MQKKNIAIVYGGKSTEHEVSIRSARNIAKAIDRNKYNLLLIAIGKNGVWYSKTEEELAKENIVKITPNSLALKPGNTEPIINTYTNVSLGKIDAIFPIVHGTGGEDGTLQGLLKSIGIPFVGPGVIGSSLCIDKEVAKRVLNEAGIANSRFLSYLKSECNLITYEKALASLGVPMYIKPPNLGSSVGISKVTTKREFETAIDNAFKYDRKVLIEQNIVGREIECAVLGNQEIEASPLGEVVTVGEQHTFYSYAAKYTDANGSVTVIPAKLDANLQSEIQHIAIKTYKALCCEGMARVDVFVTESNEIIVNEVNTLPGFTDISMYPKLWEAGGISYSDLISRLIDLALERGEEEDKMQTSV